MLENVHGILRSIELQRDKVSDWDRHPFLIQCIANLHSLDLHPQVTFLVGENGSGKSTLLEAIAIALGLNAEGGTKNFQSAHRPSESSLYQHLRLVRGIQRERSAFFLRAETMFNVSTEAEAHWADARLHEMSHGEAFLWVAMNRFGGKGLYLLDEPEAALSPQRQLAFLARIHELANQGSQFIISTHSPILMAYPEARIYQLGEQGIQSVNYQDTDHYTITQAVLTDPERMMQQLLGLE